MFFISQSGKEDCAFTCLAILLANVQHDRNYLFLKHEDRQYNFKELIGIARNYKVNLLGVRVTDPNELLNCEHFPFIAVVKNRNKESHSVLVTKISKKFVYFIDPQLGKRKMTFIEFTSKWTRFALLIKNFDKCKCSEIPKDFVKKKDLIILSITQLIGSISLLIGTFFLDKESYFYLPIVFFSLFIIFEIMFRKFLLEAMEHIEEEIFLSEIKRSETGYHDAFKTIQEFKSSSLILLPTLICSVLLAIFICVILIMNNYINVVYVIIAIAFALVKYFIFIPHFKEKEAMLIEQESLACLSPNDFEFKFLSRKANEEASKLGYKKTLFNYVMIAVFLIVSILIMYLSGIKNITYVICYLCISVFMVTTLDKMLELATKKDNYDSLKAKLINYLK